MAVGHLEFKAIYDYDTYQTHTSIPITLPLGSKVFATVLCYNDTDERWRTMTCHLGFFNPSGAIKGLKKYTNFAVSNTGPHSVATAAITLDRTGTWKVFALLDPALSPNTDTKVWSVINVAGVPEPPSDWQVVKSIDFTLIPPEEAGWNIVKSIDFTLTPTGVPPEPECETDADCPADKPFCVDGVCVECRTDADCPEGYICKAGKCVKKEVAFPWQWLAIGGAAILGGILLIPKPKKAVKKN